MIPLWGSTGGLNAGLSFWLPLNDLGAGAVNTAPASAAGSATPTFTRSTTATTVLSNGLIGSVASGTARSAYSPAGVYLGYLAEEARTNLCLQSADFSTTWATVSAATTVVVDAIASPDGTVTADKINETATTLVHQRFQGITKAASALQYTFSVYLKQAERTWAFLQVDDTVSVGYTQFFNLATGALGTGAVVGTGFTAVSASIVPAANGFYRCVLTFTTNAATSLNIQVVLAQGNTSTAAYAGTAGSGIYAWGAQLEQAAFATSYIPTTTVAVTRNADILSYPSAGNMSGATGTAYAEASSLQRAASPGGAILTGGDNNGRLLWAPTNTTATIQSSSNTATGNLASFSAGTNKLASSWTASGLSVVANGGTVGTSANSVSLTATLIEIANRGGGNDQPDGSIRNVRIWTRALPDSQLVSLTQ